MHGAYPELISVLSKARIIDEALHWSGGKTHLVGLGNLLDRGPESRKVMDLLMRLETEAQPVGGAVHVLLGNHEVMNIVGDLRYVSAAEYAAFAVPSVRVREGWMTTRSNGGSPKPRRYWSRT